MEIVRSMKLIYLAHCENSMFKLNIETDLLRV
jgi:hypothetical protein